MADSLHEFLPAPELTGPKLRLIPVAPEHHARLRELHLSEEVRRWWQDPDDDWPEPASDPETIGYAALLDREVVGYVEWWASLDEQFHHAGVDLFLAPELHGQGLGAEMARTVCAHLIDDHGFHRLVIDPEAENAAAIACYEKIGFKPVGVMRKAFRDRHGNLKDDLLMDMLAEELIR